MEASNNDREYGGGNQGGCDRLAGKECFERDNRSPATRFACSSELTMSVSCLVYAATKREVLHSPALDGMISTTGLKIYTSLNRSLSHNHNK